MIRYFLIFIVLLSAFNIIAQNNSDTELIEDFNSDTFGSWAVQGNAFGPGPAGSPVTHQMNGFLGSGYACSAGGLEASSTGTLTSPVFTIHSNTIHFLIGAQEVHFPPISYEYKGELRVELLINDKVVRTFIPGEFHALFWEAWDVSELKGESARFRIVDNDPREWAHIDVDHIVQNDFPVEGELIKKRITIDKPVLNFPVKRGDAKYYIELFVEGKQIRAMDVEIAEDEIDYWVVTDLTPWMGKELTVQTRLRQKNNKQLLDRISVEDDILDSEDLYNEKLRPQFHFSSKRGWINDPNGLVYYDGTWHLFYQHNPYNWDHSRNDYNKTWGHAVSTDLVHWEELPAAVHPDHLGPIYSGSAVIDFNNTTGFQTGEHPPMVCVYTSAGGRSPWSITEKFTQSISYSTDGGKTFIVYEGNPVQDNLDYINRDPKAIWHEPSKQWVIVLHFNDRAMEFFTSKDLIKWEWQSEFESRYLIDCPELFELPVDGDEGNKKWVLYGGPAYYYVGEFDGKKFTAQTEVNQFNFGNAFYASQTFSDVPDSDGRRVQIGWGLTPAPEMPFNQSLLFPVKLTLHSTDDGIKMFAYPVEEIKSLYTKQHDLKDDLSILDDSGMGELLDIYMEFEPGDTDEFGLVIKGKEIKYDAARSMLSGDGEEAELKPHNGKIKLRILVDRLTIEIYANDGRIYMPLRAYPNEQEPSLKIFGSTGVNINTFVVHELKSIWNK